MQQTVLRRRRFGRVLTEWLQQREADDSESDPDLVSANQMMARPIFADARRPMPSLSQGVCP